MEAASGEQLRKVLLLALRHLESAPDAWPADAVVGRSLMHPELAVALAEESHNVSGDLPLLALPEALDAELEAALRSAAARGEAAKLASALACASHAYRKAVEKEYATADVLAARGAHAQAMHDMARSLRESGGLYEVVEYVAAGLAAWCRVPDAAAALDGRFADERSAADAWRAFARAFAATSGMPSRIRFARLDVTLSSARRCAALLAGPSREPPPEEDDELTELAEQDRGTWRAQLVEMVQGAPA